MQRTSTDFAKCAAEGQTEMHKEVGTGREKFASSSELNQATLKINTGFFFFPSFSFFFSFFLNFKIRPNKQKKPVNS